MRKLGAGRVGPEGAAGRAHRDLGRLGGRLLPSRVARRARGVPQGQPGRAAHPLLNAASTPSRVRSRPTPRARSAARSATATTRPARPRLEDAGGRRRGQARSTARRSSPSTACRVSGRHRLRSRLSALRVADLRKIIAKSRAILTAQGSRSATASRRRWIATPTCWRRRAPRASPSTPRRSIRLARREGGGALQRRLGDYGAASTRPPSRSGSRPRPARSSR